MIAKGYRKGSMMGAGLGMGFPDYVVRRRDPRNPMSNPNTMTGATAAGTTTNAATSNTTAENSGGGGDGTVASYMQAMTSGQLYGNPGQYEYTPPEYDPFDIPFVNTYQSGDYAAQETMADLYEAEFADYLKRFFPIQQGLIEEMTTGFEDYQQQEVNRAQRAVARAYANTSGTQRRRMQGYGVYTKPAEIQQRETQMSEVGSTVAATNFARQRAQERRMQILSGGLGEIAGRTLTSAQGLG